MMLVFVLCLLCDYHTVYGDRATFSGNLDPLLSWLEASGPTQQVDLANTPPTYRRLRLWSLLLLIFVLLVMRRLLLLQLMWLLLWLNYTLSHCQGHCLLAEGPEISGRVFPGVLRLRIDSPPPFNLFCPPHPVIVLTYQWPRGEGCAGPPGPEVRSVVRLAAGGGPPEREA